MTSPMFAYIAHKDGVADDTAQELRSAADRIDSTRPVVAVVTGWGPAVDAVCAALQPWYDEVWKVADPALAAPNAELVRQALVRLLPRGQVVLAAHGHFGLDLAPGLSIKLDAAYVPDVIAIEARDGDQRPLAPDSQSQTRHESTEQPLIVVRQEYGGQVNARVRCDLSAGAVITIRPGSFAPWAGTGAGPIVDRSSECGPLVAHRRHVETVAAEAGDVDITKEQVLVSVGRGIGGEENIALAQELADTLGGVVSCSRPVVDAKWLEKSRQVGSSGQTVRPKIYFACAISGSFQHLAGIKGNPFLVAINKNPKAPIFRVADVGIVGDVLEVLPALTETIREQGLAANRERVGA